MAFKLAKIKWKWWITPTGTCEITENGTYDVTEYATAEVSVPSIDLKDYFTSPMPTDVNVNNAGIYYIVKKLPDDLAIGTSLRYSCFSMRNLIEMPNWDTKNVTDMRNCFQGCTSLVTARAWDMSSVTAGQNMFNECLNLENVPVFNWSSLTNAQSMFSWCEKISYESWNNIMASCISASSYTGTKTLTNLCNKIDTYIRASLQALPNYSAFVSAGWSI